MLLRFDFFIPIFIFFVKILNEWYFKTKTSNKPKNLSPLIFVLMLSRFLEGFIYNKIIPPP